MYQVVKEIPFQYDLDNPVVELKLRLSYHRGRSRGSKNNWVPIVGFPFSMRWPQAAMYQFRSPQLMIFDSCSWHVSRMLDDQEPVRYPIVGLWLALPRPIMGTSKPSLSKRKLMVIQPSPAIKHLVFQKLSLFYADSIVKTITLTPIAVREPQSSRTIKTVLLSVRRPMVG